MKQENVPAGIQAVKNNILTLHKQGNKGNIMVLDGQLEHVA